METATTLSQFSLPEGFVPPKYVKPKQHQRVDLNGDRRPYSPGEIRHLLRTKQIYYDRYTAKRACAFFERELVHVEGPLADEPFKLEPWQRRIVRRVFGWKWVRDGTRVIREVYICIPRKNGKTFLVAGFGEYLLFADGEKGAKIVCAAGEVQQAAFLFNVVREQVLRNYKLRKLTGKPFRRALAVQSTNSNFQVITSKASTKHGGNLSGVLIDELHVQPTRDLVDVLTTSVSARAQPLVIYLTTAGVYDVNSIAWEKHDYAMKVAEGLIEDISFLPVIFCADPEDDIYDPRIWYKANPNLGVSKFLWYMEREVAKARNNPAYENTVKQLDFNIWTEQRTRWMAMRRWDMCAGPVDLEALRGRPCYAGIDLSDTTDITALVLVFPHRTGEWEEYYVQDEVRLREIVQHQIVPFFWVPEDTLSIRDAQSRKLYEQWMRTGHLIGTPGEIVDHDYVVNKLMDLRSDYQFEEIGFDPWGARQTASKLEGEGFMMVEVHQGYRSLSEPSKRVMELTLQKRLSHAGHPVLRWMMSNVQVERDPAGNIKPSKAKSTGKIDGVSALVVAFNRVIVRVTAQNLYEKQGIRYL